VDQDRVNRGQELVIGGYIPGSGGFDSIVVGYYRGRDLVYVARVRNGFVPASRRQLFAKLRTLEVSDCPFVNLPEKGRSRWGEGLTADDMKKCVWIRPELVAQIEFLEWTEGDHLRHSKFAGLREDKDPKKVQRSTSEIAESSEAIFALIKFSKRESQEKKRLPRLKFFFFHSPLN